MDNKTPKYRFNWPIIGHQKVQQYLQKAIISGKVASAYLFVGPKNVGKTTVLNNFVCSLECHVYHQSSKEGKTKNQEIPCKECVHCQQYIKNIHPDIFLVKKVDDKKNIAIEQIRELQSKLSRRSFFPTYKIAIILEAENLNIAAANSLLKTLEEPTAKTILILTTTNKDFLPETIVSRCQIINFNPVKKEEIYNYVYRIVEDRARALELTRLSSGLPGKALELINQEDFFEMKKEQVREFVKILAENNINKKFSFIGQIIEQTKFLPIDSLLDEWSLVLRDLILIKNKKSELMVNLFLEKEMLKLANKLKSSKIRNFLERLNGAKKLIKNNVNPKLILENFIINF